MAYSVEAHHQPHIVLSPPGYIGSAWSGFEAHQLYLHANMGGSTSDEQSVFDAPNVQEGSPGSGDQCSESSNSPVSQQQNNESQQSNPEPQSLGDSTGQNPKQKRIACIICRRRKLKCDGARPTCSTCARLKHTCGYDETRKKSGPKRGYVKELEKRLKQIETQLESGQSQERDKSPSFRNGMGSAAFDPSQPGFGANLMPGLSASQDRGNQHRVDPESGDSFPWEMMSLGLEEPLPPQDMIDEMHTIYFEKLHPSMPMIHKYRYLAAMNLAPSMRPPVALRYAMWSYACSATDKYSSFTEMFYQRARKYAESDEMRGYGEQIFTVGHVQAWVVIANFEFKMMYFPRAWMSVGRAVRLAQMLGLNRVDGGGLEVKECLPKPKDWVDREERRRTFWAAYCFDRWASIGTGWPLNIDERDIHTELPSREENFEKGQETKTFTLTQVLTGGDPGKLSSYASVILMASIIGKTLTHLHRTEARDDAHDVENGEFWKRHRYLDHILTNTTVCLPSHLQLAGNHGDPNVIFLHMNIHSVAICLHQAAILKAEQNNLGPEIIKMSTDRCYMAAKDVANIWRMISNVDISYLSPYVAFCLFVAARVFVHAYKRDDTDTDTRQCLHFLLNAMEAHRKRNDITESFLMQLLVDLDELGFDSPVLRRHNQLMSHRDSFEVYREGSRCPPVMLKHSQTQPTFKELQRQQEADRMTQDARWRAGMFPDSNEPTSMINNDDDLMNIPIRSANGNDLHNVSLGPDYDLSVNFTGQPQQSHATQSGISANVGHTIYSHTGSQEQTGFPIPGRAENMLRARQQQQSASPGNSHGQGQNGDFNFNDPPEFDVSLLNGQFEISAEDANMMQDLQGMQDWDGGMGQSVPNANILGDAQNWVSFIPNR